MTSVCVVAERAYSARRPLATSGMFSPASSDDDDALDTLDILPCLALPCLGLGCGRFERRRRRKKQGCSDRERFSNAPPVAARLLSFKVDEMNDGRVSRGEDCDVRVAVVRKVGGWHTHTQLEARVRDEI